MDADAALEQPLTALRGVGPKVAERLDRLGLATLGDLLFHLPLRYEDRTRVQPIGGLQIGLFALVCGEVQVSEVRLGRRRSLLVRIADGTGFIDLRFFHFGSSVRQSFARGARVLCYAEARRGPSGLEMVHPEWQLLRADETPETETTLTPVYRTTEGLTQNTLRRLSDQALAAARAGALPALLPPELLAELRLGDLTTALAQLHHPPAAWAGRTDDDGNLAAARARLAFEELLAHHLSHRAVRTELGKRSAPRLSGHGTLEAAFERALGFQLTGAQVRVVEEVRRDLAGSRPMYRLVQGDVGSGKTVVAALAAVRAIESHQQAAVMAPTELLAEQHMRQFSDWFEPLGVRVAWLGGRQPARARRDTLEALANGDAALAVGTHALFQQSVRFARLGLVIIDEQHRFGVHQRHALLNKGAEGAEERYPHQLIMTATPIPRTLQMTAYAHLDVSSIDELPPGRQPVETAVLPDTRRPAIVERIAVACAAGQQAYWVCPLIDESEAIAAEAAGATAELLAEALPSLSIGLVHGRMKNTERDAVMNEFRAGTIDLLVATTVIEVGVDVPNASLMIIENAERMGLSQLHQLRGRVGRGTRRSACVLVYKAPLGALARARLAVLRNTSDGFEIARRDLELRGPGEVLGTRQTGDSQFRVADLGRDQALMDNVVRAADHILAKHADVAPALVRRWVGRAVAYGEVG